jgi:hypothetical protein
MENHFKNLFQEFWISRKDQCVLCGKSMKFSSVSQHLKGNVCKIMLKHSPEQRISLFSLFQECKIKKQTQTPHELSIEEILASNILQLTAFKYSPKLQWFCKLINGEMTWIDNSLLSLSTVGGKWIKRGQRARKKGIIKDLTRNLEASNGNATLESIHNSLPTVLTSDLDSAHSITPETISKSSSNLFSEDQTHEDEDEDLSMEIQKPSEDEYRYLSESDFQAETPADSNSPHMITPEDTEFQEEKSFEEDQSSLQRKSSSSKTIEEVEEEEEYQEETEASKDENEEEESSKDEEYEIEEILSRKTHQGKIYYKVKWVGYEETSWEPFQNLIGCKEALAEYHGHEKIPMSAFQFSYLEQFTCLDYLKEWVKSSNSLTKEKQRKGILCYLFTALCQETGLTLRELVEKHPNLSRLMCNISFSHKLWNVYKSLHSNPQSLRNQSNFLRDLFSFLISYESEASVIIRLNTVKEFWNKECKYWSRKANTYRRFNRTKSKLQETSSFLSSEELKGIDEVCKEKMQEIQQTSSK